MNQTKLTCSWKNCKNVILMNDYCCRHLKQTCLICLENVPSTNSAKSKRLSCGHAFHFDCIINWFVESDVCPVCRKEQGNDSTIKFKNKIENKMRKIYQDAIRSLEDDIRQITN